MNIEELVFFAQKVRMLLENRVSSHLPYTPFNEFPHGCCSDASAILSALLKEVKQVHTVVVSWDCGQSGLIDSHAWVELNDTCIDITLDQFNTADNPQYLPVYVGRKNNLHQNYEKGERCSVTSPGWLPSVVDDLKKLFP